jgi:hypothetical protein
MPDTPRTAVLLDAHDELDSGMDSILNSEAPWERFDSVSYHDHNYASLRDDDRRIMKRVRDHFIAAKVPRGRGIDVGSGTNLYPAMAMLPFCRDVQLWEFAPSNVEWLRSQISRYDSNWDEFWAVYRSRGAYAEVNNPRLALAKRAKVHHASVFDLPARRWDMGTMFFVACSISTDMEEFDRAVVRFARSLKAGAPFAAAFMKKSRGYWVEDVFFPAVSIASDDIYRSLASVAYDVDIQEIPTDNPLRAGYEGMLLAVGRAVG